MLRGQVIQRIGSKRLPGSESATLTDGRYDRGPDPGAQHGRSSCSCTAQSREVARRDICLDSVTDDLRIVLDVAGLPGPGLAVKTLATRGLVEIINPLGRFLEAGAVVVTSIGAEPWADADGATIAATPEPVFETIINSDDIVEANGFEDQFGGPVVGFTLSRRAAEDFEAYTSANIGLPMSIGGEIQGLSKEEVDALVIQLSSPPLPARIEIERAQINPEAA